MAIGPLEMAISKDLPGVQSMTVALVDHRRTPFLFVPVKTAPRAGPVAPFSHDPPTFSGESSPIRGRSATNAHADSAGAAISRTSATG